MAVVSNLWGTSPYGDCMEGHEDLIQSYELWCNLRTCAGNKHIHHMSEGNYFSLIFIDKC